MIKIFSSGVEVTPEEFKKRDVEKWFSPSCPDLPTGCIGQPGGIAAFHFLEPLAQDTKANHRESSSQNEKG